MSVRFLTFCAAVGLLALVVYLLVIAQSLLLPLVIAIVIWYLIVSLSRAYKELRRFGIPLPNAVSLLLGTLTVVIGLYLLVVLVNSSINEVIAAAPRYQERFFELVRHVSLMVGVTDDPLSGLWEDVSVTALISRFARAITGLAGDLGLIVVYVLFLLLETRTFQRKLDALAADESRRENLHRIMNEIGEDIKTYVRIKTVLNVITAGLSYVVMKIAGVDFAEFWAVLIFIMNYIPSIGWVLGVVFPVLLTLIQFESVAAIATIISLMVVIPVFINNVAEPRLMGQSLNLSALVIILSLAVWGYIWGVLGMFLGVPIMVIINIVLAKFPQTRPIAVLLSANGRVNARFRAPEDLVNRP